MSTRRSSRPAQHAMPAMTGRKQGGSPPEPPVAGPAPKDRSQSDRRGTRSSCRWPKAALEHAYVAQDHCTRPMQPAEPHQRRGPGPHTEHIENISSRRSEALARLSRGAKQRKSTLLAGLAATSARPTRTPAPRLRDCAVDHARPGISQSSLLEGPLPVRAAAKENPHSAGSDDTSKGDSRGPATLRSAQANAGSGVRHPFKSRTISFRQFSLRGHDSRSLSESEPRGPWPFDPKENVHLARCLSWRPEASTSRKGIRLSAYP